MAAAGPVEIPRNFRLLAQLEQVGDGTVTVGLQEGDDDIYMHKWQGLIIGPSGSPFDSRIYNLSLFVSDEYPYRPPQVRFLTRVNLPCVEANGVVNPARLPILAQWRPDYDLLKVRRRLSPHSFPTPRSPPLGCGRPPSLPNRQPPTAGAADDPA